MYVHLEVYIKLFAMLLDWPLKDMGSKVPDLGTLLGFRNKVNAELSWLSILCHFIHGNRCILVWRSLFLKTDIPVKYKYLSFTFCS